MALEYIASSTLTADGDGAASGSILGVQGRILVLHVIATIDGTLTLTVKTAGVGSLPVQTLLTLAGISASATYRPMVPVHTNAGAAKTYDGTRTVDDYAVIQDDITLTVASGTEGDTVQVVIEYQRL